METVGTSATLARTRAIFSGEQPPTTIYFYFFVCHWTTSLKIIGTLHSYFKCHRWRFLNVVWSRQIHALLSFIVIPYKLTPRSTRTCSVLETLCIVFCRSLPHYALSSSNSKACKTFKSSVIKKCLKLFMIMQ